MKHHTCITPTRLGAISSRIFTLGVDVTVGKAVWPMGTPRRDRRRGPGVRTSQR